MSGTKAVVEAKQSIDARLTQLEQLVKSSLDDTVLFKAAIEQINSKLRTVRGCNAKNGLWIELAIH
jgi:flagellar biosynthesis/type III secretory pathway chaperone